MGENLVRNIIFIERVLASANNGIDTLQIWQGILIVDKTVQRVMGGTVDYEKDYWYIPYSQNNLITQEYSVIETTEE
ncbi:MAG: hypothetical protein CM15mP87_10120 [Candidatus Neomarinimicrobiota bacterium]|nr:MAG: hypothetical protein CM15mP87_10120 [Candidatus Neomarinimicrobiota bacterium]